MDICARHADTPAVSVFQATPGNPEYPPILMCGECLFAFNFEMVLQYTRTGYSSDKATSLLMDAILARSERKAFNTETDCVYCGEDKTICECSGINLIGMMEISHTQ